MKSETVHHLSHHEAYQSMMKFLENYYNTTGSDEIAGLLGSMSMSDDGKPMDPAYWDEWLAAIKAAKCENQEEK